MITIRKSADRGHFDLGWLNTYHTFSFGHYRDPDWMGFRSLRVLNQDRVQPGTEFPTHPHQDMEIISYVLSGELAHQDSMGNGSVIRPGDVQRMSAGTGVTHSESNHSQMEVTHFLQIWLYPSERGLEPGYEQKTFTEAQKLDQLCLIASPDGRNGSVTIHQDALVYSSILEPGREEPYEHTPDRGLWVQVVTGKLNLNGFDVECGDGVAVEDEGLVMLRAVERCEFLLFDLS